MFVQVIHGQVSDPAAMKAMVERWSAELGPGASGFLAETSGVTADGTFILFACFESAEAARRNSDRPEQGAWWSEASALFSTEPVFEDYDDVVVVRSGPTAEAGFVQAMTGSTSDAGRARELTRQFDATAGDFRPDILGGIVGISDGGRFAQAFYFRSESEARIAEKQEVPAELAESFAEEQRLMGDDITYYDLTAPWHLSAS